MNDTVELDDKDKAVLRFLFKLGDTIVSNVYYPEVVAEDGQMYAIDHNYIFELKARLGLE